MKVKSIDVSNSILPLHTAIEELFKAEIAKDPEIEQLIFIYKCPLFVLQLFTEGLDRLAQDAQSISYQSLQNSSLKKILLLWIDETGRQREMVLGSTGSDNSVAT